MLLPLTLVACTTTKYVEVPVYIVEAPAKPESPNLQELSWQYLPEQQYFALDAENFDTYRSNMQELDTYIKLLQEGWKYLEDAATDPES
jgi:hypothetical protein